VALGHFLGKEDGSVVVVHRDLSRSSLPARGAR
jgi:hypothetical protein